MPSVRRLAPAAVAAALLLLSAVACGGGTTSAGSGAAVAPASAPVYVSLLIDDGSEQWRQAGALVRRLPGGDEILRGLLSDREGADWETEVKPALGPELVVVVLDLARGGDAAVALTQPDDVDAFEKLAAQDGQVTREIAGWWAVADTEELLDRFEQARDDGTLEDADAFQEATAGLPAERLALVYANAQAGLASAPGMLDEETLRCFAGGEEQEPAAFAISAADGGFRIDSGATSTPFSIDSGASDLDDKLPAGAVAFASAHNGAAVLRHLLDCAGDSLGLQLGQLEAITGISPEKDLLPLFEGETALAVYPPSDLERDDPQPTVAVVTQVADTEDVLASFDRHLQALGPLAGNLTLRDSTVDGLAVRTVSRDGRPIFAYAARDGLFVLANAPAGVLVLNGGGPTLAEDDRYRAALDAAGAPDETVGLVYVDVAAISSLFTGTGYAGGDGLAGLVVWGERDGDAVITQGFLAID